MKCSICGQELNVITKFGSKDCGGDCLACMVQADDPGAVEAAYQKAMNEATECGSLNDLKLQVISFVLGDLR